MKNVIKTLLQVLKALPIVIELLEIFQPKHEDSNTSSVRKFDKDIIDSI